MHGFLEVGAISSELLRQYGVTVGVQDELSTLLSGYEFEFVGVGQVIPRDTDQLAGGTRGTPVGRGGGSADLCLHPIAGGFIRFIFCDIIDNYT